MIVCYCGGAVEEIVDRELIRENWLWGSWLWAFFVVMRLCVE